jgi:phosphoglycerate dehydrogenase-like enzyme
MMRGSPPETVAAREAIAAPLPRRRPKALFLLEAATLDVIYGPEERGMLERMAQFSNSPQTRESIRDDPSPLADVEVIFSGWGAPLMDEAFLAAAPNLKAVFYGAGSVRNFVTEAFWRRGILLTSAYAANAEPVAEYTLATVLLSLKKFWSLASATRRGDGWGDHTRIVPGGFRATVGLISCGMVARRTLELLRNFDLHRLVYCPFLTEAEAEELQVELCTLSAVFRRADVVSLHTPELPETRGLITGEHFRRMKLDATFINTARGAVVRESEMLDVLEERRDLTAVLDVCKPEPPEPGSRLLTLPNVVLTPHIAGSLGPECRRLGSYMVEEFRRYLRNEPLRWGITQQLSEKLA